MFLFTHLFKNIYGACIKVFSVKYRDNLVIDGHLGSYQDSVRSSNEPIAEPTGDLSLRRFQKTKELREAQRMT